MEASLIFAAVLLASMISASSASAEEGLASIKTVEIGENREFRVNGKPFFPIMLWLQSHERIDDGLRSGVNTFCANGGSLSRRDYLDQLAQNGLYGVVHFGKDHKEVSGHSHLLGWIHSDEPDLTTTVSDATVEAGPGMRPNQSTPLYRIVDGNLSSWTVLDPMDDAQITIQRREPVTVQSLAVALTISAGLSVAKEVAMIADGKDILKATLENKKGRQRFELEEPVTLENLTFKVLSSYSGENKWGSIAEIEGFDEDGNNVLLSPPRQVARTLPAIVTEHYRQIKASDDTRPVLVTFTGSFYDKASRFDEATRQSLYPEYVSGCDVAGFDIYPIFGSGYPSRLNWVAEATEELVRIAGKRPVYAWIETNKGSRWMTLSKQLDVKPKHTRSETWMAIIRGATAIGYFTHRWQPDYKQFAPEQEMVVELKRLNDQITWLTPTILAAPARPKITMSLGSDLPCHFKATEHDGALYIFAQNVDLGPGADKRRQFEQITPRSGKAVFTVEGLKAGTNIEVIDEDRLCTAEENRFTDDFAPLAEHIYRFTL